MILHVQPAHVRSRGLKGTVRLPASKSYSIRAFIISACGGKSKISHPSDCDDALVAASVAKQLGAKIQSQKNIFLIEAHPAKRPSTQINVRESGTVLRLLVPLLAVAGHKGEVTGKGTLIGRPNRHLLETLRRQGVKVKGSGPQESIPIQILGGEFKTGTVTIDGSVSSQFVSALLIACSQLPDNTTVELKGRELVSTDYIQMTTAVLAQAGIKVKKISGRKYRIAGGQKFSGLKNFSVPSDYGLAAFLMAAAALLPSDVTFKGHFDDRFIQADGKILEFLKKMGVTWTRTKEAIRMKGPFRLRGGTFSLQTAPDLVPIMAVLGLFSEKPVKLTHIGHARVKESDRISDLRNELLKVGARVDETVDTLTVYPLNSFRGNVVLDPHRDHRLAMAFAVLGLKIGLRIQDIECTKKSYPGFVADLQALGAPFSISASLK